MKFFLSLFFLFLSTSLIAKCISGDCINGYGTYVWDEGDKYIGESKDNLFHGQGTYYYDNGDKYVVSINSFSKPTEEEIQEIIAEYSAFGEERFSSKMQQIINDDVFQSAKVNLNDLIQF